jgi:UPF0271 protein
VRDEEQAAAVVDAVTAFARAYGRHLPVLGLPGSALLRLAAAAGLPTVAEAFADRAYTPEGTLVPRTEPGAVLHEPDAVLAQALGIAVAGEAATVSGARVQVAAASLCLHGDTPGAAALATRVRGALEQAGVAIEAFA